MVSGKSVGRIAAGFALASAARGSAETSHSLPPTNLVAARSNRTENCPHRFGNLRMPAETIEAGSMNPARQLGRKHMRKLILAFAVLALTPWAGQAQDAKAVLDGAVKAMGDVNSLQFSGSGAYFAFGQAYTPGAEWPLTACAVQRRRFPVGASPTPRFAPAGSNRSSHGGNEMAEAFD